MLARVQEQLASRWEGNQALAARTRDQLAQHEAGLMDLREALNRAVGITREAEELNSSNQERLEEALVSSRLSPLLPSPSPTLPALLPLLVLLSLSLPSLLFLFVIHLPYHSSLPPASEAGAVQGQCHSEGHPAGSQQ